MATDSRKHSAFAAGEKPTMAALNALSLSINDNIPVSSATDQATTASNLSAAGYGASAANPVTTIRQDARGLHKIEYTVDGTNFTPASGVLSFASDTARDTWTTSYSSLLTVWDRCISNSLPYTWTGTGWAPDYPAISRNSTSDQTGITTTATAITGVSTVIPTPSSGGVILLLSGGLATYSSDQNDVVNIQLKDGATTVATWNRSANSSPSTNGTTNNHNFETTLPSITGTKTYTLAINRVAGTGSITVANATYPAWLMARRIG